MALLRLNEQFTLHGTVYRVTEHPSAPGHPYGQEGRQATVYQVAADSDYRALKVFKPRYRLSVQQELAKHLARLADLPGLAVCRRIVITQVGEPNLVQVYPDLDNSVLMPWIEGPTWFDLLSTKHTLTPDQSVALTRAFIEVVARMEQKGLAHGDLSGPNILIPALAPRSSASADTAIALVDVEQLYGPGFDKPLVQSDSSPGYAMRVVPPEWWSEYSDRFPGAILTVEMLCWHDENVRKAAWGESFFDPDEVQQDTERYQLLCTVLRDRYGHELAELFARVWHSPSPVDCPRLGEWLLCAPATSIRVVFDAMPSGAAELVQTMIQQAGKQEERGDWSGALTTYRAAMSRLRDQDPLRTELGLIIANVEKQQQAQEALNQTIQRAEGSAHSGDWKSAVQAYETVIGMAPQSPSADKWRMELKHSQEELDLMQRFDGARAALERGERQAAKELLNAVVQIRPGYVRNDQRATTLLEQVARPSRLSIRSPGLILTIGVGGFMILAILLGLVFAWTNYTKAQNDAQTATAISVMETATEASVQRTVAAAYAQQTTMSGNATGTMAAVNADRTSTAISIQQTTTAENATRTQAAFIASQTASAISASQTAVAISASQTASAISASQTAVAISASQTASAISASQTAVAISASQTAGAISASQTVVAISASQTAGAIRGSQTAAAIIAQQNAAALTAAAVRVPPPQPTPVPPAVTYVRLVNQLSQKCLTVDGDYTHITQWSCSGGDNQLWVAPGNGPLKSKSGVCITYTSDHAELLQTTNCGGSPSWGIGPWSGAYFEIVTGGDCLDVDSRSKADGAWILHYPCSADLNQLWQQR